MNLLDTIRMFNALEGPAAEKVKQFPKNSSILDIHNRLNLLAKKVSGSKQFHIPSEIQILESLVEGNYIFKVLDTPDEYAKMGTRMENCVGDLEYTLETLKGNGYILYVTDKETEHYLLELKRAAVFDKYTIRQFYGVKNARVPDEVKEPLSKLILDTIEKERNSHVHSIS